MKNKTIALYEPFSDLAGFNPFFGRFFERVFGDLPAVIKEDIWMPAIDIEEKNGTIEVKAELPGMKKDDIKVTIHDNMLTLSGERKHEKETDHKTFHRIERAYGKFIRTIALPVSVSADKIKAQFRDGVLQVILPKPEALKPADIKIETN